MAFIVADRVRETSTTTGTGTFTLSGAVSGYQTFSSAIGNTNTTYYTISNSSANEWEVGLGTVGAGTLARTTILSSSNAGSAVDFSAGTKDVFCTYPAEKTVFTDNTATLTNKTISGASNTFSNIGNSSLTNSAVTVGSTSVSLGATTTTLAGLTSVASGQVNITGQGDLRLEDTTGGEYVALQAPATLAASYTLTMPSDDGTNGQVLTTDGSGNLAWATDAGGDVVGPSSATDNAVSRFDGTTGKLIQNSGVIIDDSNNVTGVVNLTSSGSVTLSGGTANGVAYLNGSKVLTTGSALTFDGSNTLQINGSANAVLKINAIYGSGTSIIDLTASGSTAQDTRIVGGAGSTSNISFITSGSEQMRLTSTGLGIGTSSPDYSLCVVKASNDAWIKLQGGGSSQHSWLIGSTNSGLTYYDNTAAAYRMYLDNSGNLGLGVTPSAWSVGKWTQILNASFGGYSSYAYMNANCNYDGSWKYIASDYASRYEMNSNLGKHQWFVAPSGTAGNAITFTQAMTLDASGNLGIGTSSPTQKLHIYTASTGAYTRVEASTGTAYFGIDSTGVAITTPTNTAMYFGTNDTERMRIDSSGNVGIGTSSPTAGYKLDVYGSIICSGNIYDTGTLALAGATAPTTANNERITISNQYDGTIQARYYGAPGSNQKYLNVGWNMQTYGSGSSGYMINGVTGIYRSSAGGSLYVAADQHLFGSLSADGFTNASPTFTERMRIDSSGNLGLGVTPSAWSLGKAIQVGSAGDAAILGYSNQAYLISNAYYNAGWKYTASSAAACMYQQGNNGYHYWSTAPSGTAGNAISFTQAMTLDASGNLLVGKTSTGLTVQGIQLVGAGQSAFTAASGNVALYVNNLGSGGQSLLEFRTGAAATTVPGSITTDGTNLSINGYTNLIFGTNSTTERMRIDSSGNVGIGTSSPQAKLDVNGSVKVASSGYLTWDASANWFIQSDATNWLRFATNGSERMRIDATGNVLVAQAARATITTDNDLSFDMNAASNFQCTPSATGALTFTNITSGQSGYVLLINTGGYAITAAASTKVGSTFLSTVSTAGTYLISYFSTGSAVYCTASGALS